MATHFFDRKLFSLQDMQCGSIAALAAWKNTQFQIVFSNSFKKLCKTLKLAKTTFLCWILHDTVLGTDKF